MRRRKFTRDDSSRCARSIRQLFLGAGTFAERLAVLQGERDADPAIAGILDFLRTTRSGRLCLPRRPRASDRAQGHACHADAVAAQIQAAASSPAAAPCRLRWRTLLRAGRTPVILLAFAASAIRERITSYRHHWVALGQLGRLARLAARRAVAATSCSSADWCGRRCRRSGSISAPCACTPRIIAAFRGGDNHLLTGIGRIVEMHGFAWSASESRARTPGARRRS